MHGEGVAHIILPGYNQDIVRYEGRNAALENCRVALDDILVVDFCGVQLLDHWKR